MAKTGLIISFLICGILVGAVPSAHAARYRLSSLDSVTPVPGSSRYYCALSSSGSVLVGVISGEMFYTASRRSTLRLRGRCSSILSSTAGASSTSAQVVPVPTAAATTMPVTPVPVRTPVAAVSVPATQSMPAIPALDSWERQMLTYGAKHCALLKDSSQTSDTLLAATYYDAEWIYNRIADYTGDASWRGCAQAAEKVYRDRYIVPAAGKVPGYWVFTHGLLNDYLATGDQASKNALLLLSHYASFNADTTPLSYTTGSESSREVAYAIMAYINEDLSGEPKRSRIEPLVDQALSHIDQWCVSQTAPYVRPFMVALTAQALISYDEMYGGDPRIIPALTKALDWIWDHAWLPDMRAFRYTDRVTDTGGMEAAPDLNLLIAPAYAWLYKQTRGQRFLERGDAVFSGGVQSAFLNNAKQFNQNYRWSFDYVNWRSGR